MSTAGPSVDPELASSWREALDAAVSGREVAEELIRLSSVAGAEELVAEALERGLRRQDWDAVEALLPVCRSAPCPRYAAPLSAILDRQCLEISNGLLVEALARVESPEALPALQRAHARTSVPEADWAPDALGQERAEQMRGRCTAILRTLEAGNSTEGERVTALLEQQAIDWTDFETAGTETRKILEHLDEDRASLRGLIEAAGGAVEVGEDGNEVAIALHDAAEKGFRLRLHLFRDSGAGRPHTHSHSFSVRILAGRYRHTWYERTGDAGSDSGLTPYLTREEMPGNTYTLHRDTVHSVEPSPHTVVLVLSEMAGEDRGEKGAADLYEETVAVLERLDVI